MDATRATDVDDSWFSPSPRLLTMRRAEIAVCTIVIAAAVLTPLLRASRFVLVICYVGLVAFGLVCEYIAGRRYRSWGYCERSRDLLVRRGVLVRRLTVVPYGRMQLVDVTAGAAERVFGLATIKLHTAASATDARIPGLPPDEATRLRDQLAALGEAQAAGV
jgi:hypothetical protein